MGAQSGTDQHRTTQSSAYRIDTSVIHRQSNIDSRVTVDCRGCEPIGSRGTIVAMTTDSLRNVKDRFSEFVDRVDREHERVVVTRNGRPAAVLISPDDLDSLEETLELLSDAEAVRDLVKAEAAVASGDIVRGIDAVRALRPPTNQ
jgi:antitoxin YefM